MGCMGVWDEIFIFLLHCVFPLSLLQTTTCFVIKLVVDLNLILLNKIEKNRNDMNFECKLSTNDIIDYGTLYFRLMNC